MRLSIIVSHHHFDRVLFPIRSPSPSPLEAGSEASGTRGHSPTRSGSPTVREGPPPPAPLPFGGELATIAEGILYYLDHNRGITTWERPQLPPYPIAPPKPPKHCLPVAKRPVKRGPFDIFFQSYRRLKLLLYYGGHYFHNYYRE